MVPLALAWQPGHGTPGGMVRGSGSADVYIRRQPRPGLLPKHPHYSHGLDSCATRTSASAYPSDLAVCAQPVRRPGDFAVRRLRNCHRVAARSGPSIGWRRGRRHRCLVTDVGAVLLIPPRHGASVAPPWQPRRAPGGGPKGGRGRGARQWSAGCPAAGRALPSRRGGPEGASFRRSPHRNRLPLSAVSPGRLLCRACGAQVRTALWVVA